MPAMIAATECMQAMTLLLCHDCCCIPDNMVVITTGQVNVSYDHDTFFFSSFFLYGITMAVVQMIWWHSYMAHSQSEHQLRDMSLLIHYVQPYASNQDGNCCWREAIGTTMHQKSRKRQKKKHNAIR